MEFTDKYKLSIWNTRYDALQKYEKLLRFFNCDEETILENILTCR